MVLLHTEQSECSCHCGAGRGYGRLTTFLPPRLQQTFEHRSCTRAPLLAYAFLLLVTDLKVRPHTHGQPVSCASGKGRLDYKHVK